MRIGVVGLMALLAVASLALPPVAADNVTLTLTSGPPQEGDYSMQVAVSGISLKSVTENAANVDGEGHLLFYLNGEPCADAANCDGPYATDFLSFQYLDLQPGDAVSVEVVRNDGTSLLPRVVIERVVPGTSTTAPDLRLASAPPVPGDAWFNVTVANFRLVSPAEDLENVAGEGHIEYRLNDFLCKVTLFGSTAGKCPSGGATDQTSFHFSGLELGDKVSARLVRNDGTKLSPAREISFIVVSEAVAILSAAPRAGDYVMDVGVGGVALVAPPPAGTAPKPNALGEGHLVYLLNDAPCIDPSHCVGKAQTAATHYTYKDLDAGDVIGVRVLNNDGTPKDGPGALATIEDGRTTLRVLAPQLKLSTSSPNPGETYVLKVSLRNGELVAPGSSGLDVAPQGHFVYLLNGKSCTDVDNCVGDAVTTSPTYTYKALQPGDIVGAEFVRNSGLSYSPAIRTVLATAIPVVTIEGVPPHAGDVNITVRVTGFRLLSVGNLPNNAGEGHLRYTLNGATCDDTTHCNGTAITDGKLFRYVDVKKGDVLGVELVRNDGSSLDPPVKADVTVLGNVPRPNPLPAPGPVAFVVVLCAALLLRRRD